ncbi:MAG: hypothetical protein ACXAD7_13680 [Candidatus Kariarchaeaceae archaeon]
MKVSPFSQQWLIGVSGALGSPLDKVLELHQKSVTRASPVSRVHKPGDIPTRNPPALAGGGCRK